MAKSPVPTGRPRIFRIQLEVHTGIDPGRTFWEYVSTNVRPCLRPEYLRRCLLLGHRFGKTVKTDFVTDLDPGGKILKVRLRIQGDDPELGPFLSKYSATRLPAARTLWVLGTCLAGHAILTGALKGAFEGPDDLPGKEEKDPAANRPGLSEKLRKGLFHE